MSDLRDDEPPAVLIAATAIRQARQGEPFDSYEMAVCSQDDVNRARRLVEAIASAAGSDQCPACSAPSYYIAAADRYAHRDGSANEPCWLALLRGDAP